LDKHLADTKQDYLVGNKCTIADIAHWGWIAAAGWAEIDIEEFTHLKAWEERMLQRPAVEKGRNVPSKHTIKEMAKDKATMDAAASKTREWIQASMKEDAAKSKV
jgi:glutathione S-transferase